MICSMYIDDWHHNGRTDSGMSIDRLPLRCQYTYSSHPVGSNHCFQTIRTYSNWKNIYINSSPCSVTEVFHTLWTCSDLANILYQFCTEISKILFFNHPDFKAICPHNHWSYQLVFIHHRKEKHLLSHFCYMMITCLPIIIRAIYRIESIR